MGLYILWKFQPITYSNIYDLLKESAALTKFYIDKQSMCFLTFNQLFCDFFLLHNPSHEGQPHQQVKQGQQHVTKEIPYI